MASSTEWVLLARILRPQGRKGEVLADLFTDFPDRFADRPGVWLAPNGFAESEGSRSVTPVQSEVKAYWLPVGRNAGRIVLHLAGVESINDAEKLSGREVVIPLSERLPLESDAAYISDLMGCTVYDRETALGLVEDVQFPTTADGSRLEDAAPLLVVVSQNGAEVLIPFAKAFLVRIDTESRSIRMSLPEGLVDLNARAPAKKEKAAQPE